MKKFFTILFIVAVSVMINSCGASKDVVYNDPYEGYGYGASELENGGKSIAKELAFGEACAEITRKSGVRISMDAVRHYDTHESARGKSNESMQYASNVATRSDAVLTDIYITKEKVYRKKNKWVCEVWLKASNDNVESDVE